MKNVKLVANALLFQAGWWVIVLLHNTWALLVIAGYLVVHFVWIAKDRKSEAVFLFAASTVGILLDSLWFYVGIMQSGTALWLPLWLLALWPLFLSTLHHSLHWLSRFPLLAAGLAAIFAPMSYWAGAALSPVSFPNAWLAMAVIALGWAIVLPVCLRFCAEPAPAGSSLR